MLIIVPMLIGKELYWAKAWYNPEAQIFFLTSVIFAYTYVHIELYR